MRQSTDGTDASGQLHRRAHESLLPASGGEGWGRGGSDNAPGGHPRSPRHTFPSSSRPRSRPVPSPRTPLPCCHPLLGSSAALRAGGGGEVRDERWSPRADISPTSSRAGLDGLLRPLVTLIWPAARPVGVAAWQDTAHLEASLGCAALRSKEPASTNHASSFVGAPDRCRARASMDLGYPSDWARGSVGAIRPETRAVVAPRSPASRRARGSPSRAARSGGERSLSPGARLLPPCARLGTRYRDPSLSPNAPTGRRRARPGDDARVPPRARSPVRFLVSASRLVLGLRICSSALISSIHSLHALLSHAVCAVDSILV